MLNQKAVKAEHQSVTLYSVHNLLIKHKCSPVNKSSIQSASAQPRHSPTAAISVIFIKYFITQSISFMMGILILSVTSSNSGSANKNAWNVFRFQLLCLWPWCFVAVFLSFFAFICTNTQMEIIFYLLVFRCFASVFCHPANKLNCIPFWIPFCERTART